MRLLLCLVLVLGWLPPQQACAEDASKALVNSYRLQRARTSADARTSIGRPQARFFIEALPATSARGGRPRTTGPKSEGRSNRIVGLDGDWLWD